MKKSVVILLHIGYWLLYLLLFLLIIFSLSVGTKTGSLFTNVKLLTFLAVFAIAPALAGFYTYYGLLFSKLLTHKKLLLFFLAAIASALLAGVAVATLLTFLSRLAVGPGILHDGWRSAIPITIIMAVIALLNGMVGLVMKGFITWYGDIKLKQDLADKNHAMELALVKSQIDPHFLFNTINNIDVMIEMDAAKASAYLNKLSGMMRFMLYETKTAQIPLQNELDYIRQYISLQQIRVTNPGYVHFNVTGDVGSSMIHAMIFIPFIENAFKHNADNKADGAIQIGFVIEPGCIIFTCKNTCSGQPKQKSDVGGIGNELIQRRLTLLYGPKHQLQIDDQPTSYSVTLKIDTA